MPLILFCSHFQSSYFYYINIYKYYSVPFLNNSTESYSTNSPLFLNGLARVAKQNTTFFTFIKNLFNFENNLNLKSSLNIPQYQFLPLRIFNLKFFIKSKIFLSRMLHKPIRLLTFNLVIKNTRTNFFVFLYRKIYNLKQILFRKLNKIQVSRFYKNNRLNKLESSFKSSYSLNISQDYSYKNISFEKLNNNWETLFFSNIFTFKSKLSLKKKKKRSSNRRIVKAYLKYLKFMKYKIFFFSSGGYDSCKKKFRRSSTRVMLFIRRLKRKLIPKFFKKKMDIFNVIFNGRMRKCRKYIKAVRFYFYNRYKSFRWMYNQIKEVRALIYINAPIRETNRYTRSISFSIFRSFNNIRKKLFTYFFSRRPKKLLYNMLMLNISTSIYAFFFITIYFFIIKYQIFNQDRPFFINSFSKKVVMEVMQKVTMNEKLMSSTKRQLVDTYRYRIKKLAHKPWNWILSTLKRNRKKKQRTFFTRSYWKLKKQIASKLTVLPLKIFVLDVTSYPFNGCKRVKRYVKKRNKKTT